MLNNIWGIFVGNCKKHSQWDVKLNQEIEFKSPSRSVNTKIEKTPKKDLLAHFNDAATSKAQYVRHIRDYNLSSIFLNLEPCVNGAIVLEISGMPGTTNI